MILETVKSSEGTLWLCCLLQCHRSIFEHCFESPLLYSWPGSPLKFLGKQKKAEVTRPLPHTGTTWMELQGPGLGLAQQWLLQSFGEWPIDGSLPQLSLPCPLSFSVVLTNKTNLQPTNLTEMELIYFGTKNSKIHTQIFPKIHFPLSLRGAFIYLIKRQYNTLLERTESRG